MTSVTVETAPGTPVKPKVSRDDWTMRAFMGVIGLYLLVALAFPLYAMFSKSLETYSFRLDQVEFQVDPGTGWGPVLNALTLGEALGKFSRDDLSTSAGAQIQVIEFFPDFSFLSDTKYRVRLLVAATSGASRPAAKVLPTPRGTSSRATISAGSRSGRARAPVSPTIWTTFRPRRSSPRSSTP